MSRILLVLTILVAVASAAAPSAGAATYSPLPASSIVDRFNLLRTTNGIPGGVVNDATLSAGCALHTNWMAMNHRMEHGEPAGSRGMTEAGAAAGRTSVLANAGSWRTGSPWLNAPMHLASMLLPELGTTGADEGHGYSCLTTTAEGSYDRTRSTATDAMFSYPGNGTTAPFYQLVYEAPYAPQVVRPDPIPSSHATGPNILVYGSGPNSLRFTHATLSGPSGTVAIKQITPQQLGYLPDSAGLVIPRDPLEPGARYTLVTSFAGLDENYADTVYDAPAISFTTTAKRLCGAGATGWYLERDCPAFGTRIRGVVAPRSTSRSSAVRGLRITTRLSRAASFTATARAGGAKLGARTARAGRTGAGVVVVPINAAALDAAFGAGSTATIAVTVRSGLALRTVQVLVTR